MICGRDWRIDAVLCEQFFIYDRYEGKNVVRAYKLDEVKRIVEKVA